METTVIGKNYKFLFVLCAALLASCAPPPEVTADAPAPTVTASPTAAPQPEPPRSSGLPPVPSNAVGRLAALGLMSAEGDSSEVLTAAQLLGIACRVHSFIQGTPTPQTSGYPWYAGFVEYAEQNGLLNPGEWNDNVLGAGGNRLQLAHLLARIEPDGGLPPRTGEVTISDMSPGDLYYDDALLLLGGGVLDFVGAGGEFCPYWAVSKAQAAEYAVRLMDENERFSDTFANVVAVTDVSGAQLDRICVRCDGTPLNLPVIASQGRYYLPGAEFAGAISRDEGTGFPRTLDGGYVSLFDLCRYYELYADFNYQLRVINLYSGYSRPVEPEGKTDVKPALIRLEDVAARGEQYASADEMMKCRELADYLYARGARFGVAWVPLYMLPEDGWENNPLDYSMYNIDFIFTMDHFVDRGGEIGLHGYTHQRGDEPSLIGTEFPRGVSLEEARSRMESAINLSASLGITHTFFEFPHYVATKEHLELAETIFDVIYNHPYRKYPTKPVFVDRDGRRVMYVHCSLDHVKSVYDADNMVSRIQSFGSGGVAALFFHPYLEYSYISYARDNIHRPSATYHDNSPLHRIVPAMEQTGRSFMSLAQVREAS